MKFNEDALKKTKHAFTISAATRADSVRKARNFPSLHPDYYASLRYGSPKVDAHYLSECECKIICREIRRFDVSIYGFHRICETIVLAPRERRTAIVNADHPHIKILPVNVLPPRLPIRLALFDRFALIVFLLAFYDRDRDFDEVAFIIY